MTARIPLIPASWGEVIDKITILEIKSARISSEDALANVRRELNALTAVIDADLTMTEEIGDLRQRLREINSALWDVEDRIRECDHRGDFGTEFVALAQSVYRHNDERAQLKRLINLATASGLVEEKSYK